MKAGRAGEPVGFPALPSKPLRRVLVLGEQAVESLSRVAQHGLGRLDLGGRARVGDLTRRGEDLVREVAQRHELALVLARDRGPRCRRTGGLLPSRVRELVDTNEEVRQRACFALAQFRDPVVVEPLLIAARDNNSEVRQQALFAIGQIDASRGKDVAIEALKDKDPEVRRMAAQLLGRLARQ